ncbi:MAG TPA: carboxypeptidase-like regulatory domain-containing protein [Bryobacteraceae bacterium]|nr:carboxypeptidase-like regulatory domain-containing protein [Bryobacteraceae bacterium]
MSKLKLTFSLLVLGLAALVSSYAQVPTGTISGTVTDESGAVIPGAAVTITNKATGSARSLTTNAEGLYSAPSLQAGDYEVRVEVQGFRTVVREAQVSAGGSTNVSASMLLGTAQEVVNVEAATAQVNYESYTIAGNVQRQNIQELPINGRNFLFLSTLEPGVATTAASSTTYNTQVTVTPLGGTVGYTRITIDGGIVNDEWQGTGQLGMNFSQEVVQEFQMSTVNFDVSSGFGTGGQINIVTRSGSNDFHGSGYFFFRDHNMAAYPGLKRIRNVPSPFFARRNPGGWVGGPILKDKLFFFSNFEYTNQNQVFPYNQDLPSLAPLSVAAASPFQGKLFTTRFDYRLSAKHTLFLRYSVDRNFGFGPYAGTAPLPSSWESDRNWSDQSVLGITSTLTPNMVNEFRFQYHFWSNVVEPDTAAECPPATCVGFGLPALTGGGTNGMVGSQTFYAGENSNSPQPRQSRVYELADNFSWQKGAHRIRFGGGLEHVHAKDMYEFCITPCTGVYSVESTQSLVAAGKLAGQLATYLPSLPTSIRSSADLLNLPVFNTATNGHSGIPVGDGSFPGKYEPGQAGNQWKPRLYVADVWKVKPNLTINGGLSWGFETGLWYTNLPMPAYLAPIVGSNNLHAPPINYSDFAPQIGFAWAIGKNQKTVIRGGAGMFWDSDQLWHILRTSANIGPLGDGRIQLSAASFTNIFPDIVNLSTGAPLAIGAPLPLNTLTNLTLGQFMQIYNQQIPALIQALAPTPPKSGPFQWTGLDYAKTGIDIAWPDFPLLRSYQTSLGIQHEFGNQFVLQADWARRQFENVDLSELDLNRSTRYVNGVQSPVIPTCTAAQKALGVGIPGQECSLGPIAFWYPEGRAVYDGLLVKLQKRMAQNYQFTASYALQKSLTMVPTVNLGNFGAGYGPNTPMQTLNLSGLGNLPWGFKLSVNNFFRSRVPVTPTLPGVDLNGAGNSNFPISEAVSSGLGYNCFNFGCGKSDLAKAVSTFNSTYAGTKDARGVTIPKYTLPPDYQFGDPTFDTDFRLTKEFALKERYRFQVFGEFFNAFNIANLTGYSFNLDTLNSNPAKQTYGFGQATGRFAQVFGSGGPRAIQVGGRISF